MHRRHFLATAASLPVLLGQPPQDPGEVQWLCPMDKDVRSAKPGVCPRCGMKLVPGIPEPVEYRLLLDVTPAAWKPGERIRMRFEIRVMGPETLTASSPVPTWSITEGARPARRRPARWIASSHTPIFAMRRSHVASGAKVVCAATSRNDRG